MAEGGTGTGMGAAACNGVCTGIAGAGAGAVEPGGSNTVLLDGMTRGFGSLLGVRGGGVLQLDAAEPIAAA
jgi:hypothetical protein